MKIEVKETQAQQVDWSKNPQLVVDEKGFIVRTLKKQDPRNKDCFCGVVLNDTDGKYDSFSTDGWIKKSFKPFHGSITLSND